MIAVLFIAAGLLCLWLAVVSRRNGWGQRIQIPTRPLPPKVTRAPVRVDVPHALYEYRWADTGRPSYYGISNEPEVRHARHGRDPDDQWWYEASEPVMYVLAWYPDRVTALAAEAATIGRQARAGEYLANTHHNPYAGRRRTR